MHFLARFDVVESVTHRLQISPLQWFTTLLDWDDVIDHLAHTSTLDTQREPLDEHGTQSSP